MATQWGKEATPVSDEQKEEFAFRGGLKQRYRQQMEDIIAGKPYDAAAKLMQDESRRRHAEYRRTYRCLGTHGAPSSRTNGQPRA